MKKLRFGIVSASSIVPRFIRALNSTNKAEVVAIASLSNKASKLAQEFHIPKVYSSYQALYKDPEIDVIYVANIHDQHAQEIRNALNHNKHVLGEKPFVLNPKEVDELFELAKEKNRFLMEAQKSVFLPVTLDLIDIIKSNKLGKLYQVSMNNSYAGRYPNDHWMHQAHQGGVWIPSANYILEYLNVVLETQPQDVNALWSTYSDQKTIDEVALTMKYDDIIVSATLTTRLQTDDMTRFYFEDGYVVIRQNWKARQLAIHYHDDRESEIISHPEDHELKYELEHVIDRINQGHLTSDVMSPDITKNCVDLVHQIYILSQQG